MNGSQHYQEAEALARAAQSMLDRATPAVYEDIQKQALVLATIGLVHATLAETAATVAPGLDEWEQVLT